MSLTLFLCHRSPPCARLWLGGGNQIGRLANAGTCGIRRGGQVFGSCTTQAEPVPEEMRLTSIGPPPWRSAGGRCAICSRPRMSWEETFRMLYRAGAPGIRPAY